MIALAWDGEMGLAGVRVDYLPALVRSYHVVVLFCFLFLKEWAVVRLEAIKISCG